MDILKAFHPITIKSDGILREIVSNAKISTPFDPRFNVNQKAPQLHAVKALWDTGATNSVVTKRMVDALGLVPMGVTNVHHGGGNSDHNVHLINIYLPNNLYIPGVRVTECVETAGRFDLIIGMDIISQGDFSITNAGRKTVFSFRLPSIKNIDYEEELKELELKSHIPITNTKIQRNDPCHCGSGKKYKHCHGS